MNALLAHAATALVAVAVIVVVAGLLAFVRLLLRIRRANRSSDHRMPGWVPSVAQRHLDVQRRPEYDPNDPETTAPLPVLKPNNPPPGGTPR